MRYVQLEPSCNSTSTFYWSTQIFQIAAVLFKCYILPCPTEQKNEGSYRSKEANKKALKLTSPSKQTKSSNKKIKEKVHYSNVHFSKLGSIHSYVQAIFD